MELIPQTKKKRKWKKIPLFILVGIFAFVVITASIYVSNTAGTNNILMKNMSNNENRTAFTNFSNDEIAFIDDAGNMAGLGFANFTTGYFQYLGGLTSRITKGWFVNLDVSNNINTSTINASSEIFISDTAVSDWLYNQSLATFSMYNATWDNSFMNIWNYNQTTATFTIYNST